MATLVFIGGWVRTKKAYHKLSESCPTDWQVIIIPYRDLIQSQLGVTIEEKLAQLLEKYHLDKFYLAGHSLGGEPCIKFASVYRDRIRGLFLIDSCGVRDRLKFLRLFRNFLFTQFSSGKQKFKEDALAAIEFFKHPILYIRLVIRFYNLNLEKQANRITSPTTLFWGDLDRLVTKAQSQKLAQYIPGSHHKTLPGMDHDWIIYSPQTFWQEIKD